MQARPICLRLLTHCARRAASRAAWTAGRSSAIRTAMIAITTSSSISVKPRRLGGQGRTRIGNQSSQAGEMTAKLGTRTEPATREAPGGSCSVGSTPLRAGPGDRLQVERGEFGRVGLDARREEGAILVEVGLRDRRVE